MSKPDDDIPIRFHDEKITWMARWCADNGLQLVLKGECGFGRECVGVMVNDTYPDYEWFDEKYNRVDENGDVWTPKDAYHKHPCVAVLGRGEEAEEQLYEWLRWFDANGFVLESGDRNLGPNEDPLIAALMGLNRFHRMVRQP